MSGEGANPGAIAVPSVARHLVLAAVGLVGAAASLTIMFLAMRSVMAVGGACASGGARQVVRPCPRGVPGLMVLSIFGGLVFLAVYAWHAVKLRGANLMPLAWSVLFGSLGWNFLDYGFGPPGAGTSGGWILCGVLFEAMAAVPLVIMAATVGLRPILWGPRGATPAARSGLAAVFGPQASPPILRTLGTNVATVAAAPRTAGPAPASAPAPSTPTGLVAALERLDALHSSGSLTDAEFAEAKHDLLDSNDR